MTGCEVGRFAGVQHDRAVGLPVQNLDIDNGGATAAHRAVAACSRFRRASKEKYGGAMGWPS
jgi:hypothetical protein